MRSESAAPRAAIVLAAGLVVTLVALAGCLDDEAPAEPDPGSIPISSKVMDTDGNGRDEWVNLTLNRTHESSYSRSAIEIHIEAPGKADASELVCGSPTLEEGACSDRFEKPAAWEPGAAKWTPCAKPGPHRIQILVHNTSVLDRLVECEEAPDPRTAGTQVSAETVDTDQDGRDDWLNLTLTEARGALYPHEMTQIDVSAPNGTPSPICDSAWLAEGACRGPFGDNEDWRVGARKWAPCTANGTHRVRVMLQNDTVLDRELDCGEPAEEGRTSETASLAAKLVSEGPEAGSWIRVTLVEAANAPYEEDQVAYNISDPSGATYEDQGPDSGDSDDILCTLAEAVDGTCDGSDFHQGPHRNRWSVDTDLSIPCQAAGEHELEIRLIGTTILNATIDCESAA
ncbi:hypothetical protein BRD56_00850 [Thermoplasmatales archaeon SW_10_69_26]|nr:MAG: hypothetical protein BRD56_00850 [Thermoplasmatales archaeon SW_10_69_26]